MTTRMTDTAAEPTGLGVDELTRLISEAAAVIHGPLSLEKKLDSQRSVVRQKEQLLGVFEAALARSETTTA